MSIEVKNIQKWYGKQEALKSISFSAKKGEIVGFLGPNGAGKSTTMKIITNYLKQDEGEVLVNGYNTIINPLQVKQTVGYLPENNPLYLEMYIKEYLEFVGNLHQIQKNRINEIIELVELKAESHKKIKELSKGYRQRVGLAGALLHNPEVLILDEPTTGLDPNQLVSIRKLIQEIGKSKTVLLSTHIMQEVEAICTRVIIINNGTIVADDSLENITQDQSLTEVFTKLTKG